MKKGKYILVLLVMSLGYCVASGQNSAPLYAPSKLPFPTYKMYTSIKQADSFRKPLVMIPANYYTQHIGFFCKEEIKMEQVHLPVKLRLGSLEYCNWLEQKPGYNYMPR